MSQPHRLQGLFATPNRAEPNTLQPDDVIWIWPFVVGALAVVAKRTVTFANRRPHTFLFRAPNKIDGIRRIAHQSIEDRSKDLRAAKSHIVVGLVDHEFHCRKLRQRNGRELPRGLSDCLLQLREGYGTIDEAGFGGLPA